MLWWWWHGIGEGSIRQVSHRFCGGNAIPRGERGDEQKGNECRLSDCYTNSSIVLYTYMLHEPIRITRPCRK